MILSDLAEIEEKEAASRKKVTLRCCMAAGCMSSNSKAVKEQLDKAVAEAGLKDEVEVRGVGCMKLCCEGPLVQADPQNALFIKVTPENAPAIIDAIGAARPSWPKATHPPFFTKQLSIVLANSGVIDPERIESYIAADGYLALHDVLHEMTPKDVRGRPSPRAVCADAAARDTRPASNGAPSPRRQAPKKYVVCNADEGDPGAFMDRSVLESDPHSVLEGMAIAAYAVGANQGYIYVRAEYPLAISRLQTAIKQAKRMGLLGSEHFRVAFQFQHRHPHRRRRIRVRRGNGADGVGRRQARRAASAPAVPGGKRVCGVARR